MCKLFVCAFISNSFLVMINYCSSRPTFTSSAFKFRLTITKELYFNTFYPIAMFLKILLPFVVLRFVHRDVCARRIECGHNVYNHNIVGNNR